MSISNLQSRDHARGSEVDEIALSTSKAARDHQELYKENVRRCVERVADRFTGRPDLAAWLYDLTGSCGPKGSATTGDKSGPLVVVAAAAGGAGATDLGSAPAQLCGSIPRCDICGAEKGGASEEASRCWNESCVLSPAFSGDLDASGRELDAALAFARILLTARTSVQRVTAKNEAGETSSPSFVGVAAATAAITADGVSHDSSYSKDAGTVRDTMKMPTSLPEEGEKEVECGGEEEWGNIDGVMAAATAADAGDGLTTSTSTSTANSTATSTAASQVNGNGNGRHDGGSGSPKKKKRKQDNGGGSSRSSGGNLFPLLSSDSASSKNGRSGLGLGGCGVSAEFELGALLTASKALANENEACLLLLGDDEDDEDVLMRRLWQDSSQRLMSCVLGPHTRALNQAVTLRLEAPEYWLGNAAAASGGSHNCGRGAAAGEEGSGALLQESGDGKEARCAFTAVGEDEAVFRWRRRCAEDPLPPLPVLAPLPPPLSSSSSCPSSATAATATAATATAETKTTTTTAELKINEDGGLGSTALPTQIVNGGRSTDALAKKEETGVDEKTPTLMSKTGSPNGSLVAVEITPQVATSYL